MVSVFLSLEAYAISVVGMHWMISPFSPMTKWLLTFVSWAVLQAFEIITVGLSSGTGVCGVMHHNAIYLSERDAGVWNTR